MNCIIRGSNVNRAVRAPASPIERRAGCRRGGSLPQRLDSAVARGEPGRGADHRSAARQRRSASPAIRAKRCGGKSSPCCASSRRPGRVVGGGLVRHRGAARAVGRARGGGRARCRRASAVVRSHRCECRIARGPSAAVRSPRGVAAGARVVRGTAARRLIVRRTRRREEQDCGYRLDRCAGSCQGSASRGRCFARMFTAGQRGR